MNVIKQEIKQCLRENYLPYAVSVISDRAIPSIDGFKPSHRKLLYTMYKMGLLKGIRTKSANIVGQTMKLNPHGDASIYETMVRLTKNNESLLLPLVDSKGNFGKVYSRDMAYAASRYTEAKLMPVAEELFKGIDKNAIEMVDNYDGTLKEPNLFPTVFPAILANGNMGIAVGLSSNICSFNLIELCDYVIDSLLEKCDYKLIPDFPTGGELLLDSNTIEDINSNGRGSISVRATYTYDKENNCIDVNSIPYTTTCEAIVDKVADLVKDGKVKEITDIRDETGLDGLKITIDLKKNVDADILMKKLYKLTPLEDSFGCNFNILIDGKPQLLGVKQIIKHWVDFRKQCIKREMEFDIEKYQEEENELLGLKIILLDIDKVISIIRNSPTEKEAINNLMVQMKLNDKQAEYVADIKLRNLNQSYLTKKIDRLESIQTQLQKMKSNLELDSYYKETIIEQLTDIKTKYGHERKTKIISQEEVEVTTDDILVENFNNQVVLTKQGYLKRTLKFSENQKLKDGDTVIQQIPSTNKSKLLLLSDKANLYYLNSHEIDLTQPSAMGVYLPSLLQLEDETVIHVISTEDFKGFILFAFENGKVAKVDLSSYSTKTNRKKVVNAYSTKSKLVSIHYIEKDDDFEVVSSIDKVLVFNTSQINPVTSKSSSGVNVLKSKKDSVVFEFKLCEMPDEEKQYYVGNIPAIGKYRR